MARRANPQVENVRMGPLALFTLVAVLCLATLAVLSLSTANATLTMAQRRATATTQLYLDEAAAQTFMATLDEQLAAGASDEDALAAAREAALGSVDSGTADQLQVSASNPDAGLFQASFDCGNGRHLDVTLHRETDGSLSVQAWRMTTVQNDEPLMGALLGSSGM